MVDIEPGLVLLRGFCGAARVSAMGRVNYLGKPFVDEVISAILGAGVRLLC